MVAPKRAVLVWDLQTEISSAGPRPAGFLNLLFDWAIKTGTCPQELVFRLRLIFVRVPKLEDLGL